MLDELIFWCDDHWWDVKKKVIGCLCRMSNIEWDVYKIEIWDGIVCEITIYEPVCFKISD